MRPTNRSECIGRPRPCPWISCKMNLLIDVSETGALIVNTGRTTTPASRRGRTLNLTRRDPYLPTKAGPGRCQEAEDRILAALDEAAEDDRPTCVLDLVEGGATCTLEEVGDLLAVTRERVRQYETRALTKIRDQHRGDEELADWEDSRVNHEQGMF